MKDALILLAVVAVVFLLMQRQAAAAPIGRLPLGNGRGTILPDGTEIGLF